MTPVELRDIWRQSLEKRQPVALKQELDSEERLIYSMALQAPLENRQQVQVLEAVLSLFLSSQ